MRFTRFLPVLFFLAISPALRAQEITAHGLESAPVYIDRLEREYNFYPGGQAGISLETAGSLKIIGWDRGSVRMEAEIKVYSLAEEKARALLEKSPVRVRYNNSVSTIQVTEPPELKGLLEVNMIVYLPGARTDLKMQLKKGDFSIDTVNGWVEATVLEGNMNLTALGGYFSGKTRKGNISVNMSGNRWSGHGFTAATQEGHIDLLLPENYSALLQLDTRNGEITVDYPSQEIEGELIPPEVVVQKKAQQLRVRVGDGGAPLSLGTQSGDVSLKKK
jgi:DUF4097 and DUF4098 domain-containing protein YvlB